MVTLTDVSITWANIVFSVRALDDINNLVVVCVQ